MYLQCMLHSLKQDRIKGWGVGSVWWLGKRGYALSSKKVPHSEPHVPERAVVVQHLWRCDLFTHAISNPHKISQFYQYYCHQEGQRWSTPVKPAKWSTPVESLLKNCRHVYDIALITRRQNKIATRCHRFCCRGWLTRCFEGMHEANECNIWAKLGSAKNHGHVDTFRDGGHHTHKVHYMCWKHRRQNCGHRYYEA